MVSRLSHLVESKVHVVSVSSSVDHPDHLILLRDYVSRRAATKESAVLAGVGLKSETIAACFRDHPQKVEEAVQAGLVEWMGGHHKPTTWKVLIEAMEHAQIAKQHIQGLKTSLGLHEGMLDMLCGILLVVTVTVLVHGGVS